jgi:hypothetical protein
MANMFSSGKFSIAMCDRCGQQFKLKQLKYEVIKTKLYQLKVCEECWDPDQPQLQLGMYPVYDPQAVREPRKDNTYVAAGLNGLQDSAIGADNGYPTGGSRDIQWGWYPVGGSKNFDVALTPNYLVGTANVGTVSVSIT